METYLTEKNKGIWQMEHVTSRTVTHQQLTQTTTTHTHCALSWVVQLVQGHLYFYSRKYSMKRSLYLCQIRTQSTNELAYLVYF